MEAWARYVMALVDGKPPQNVVPLAPGGVMAKAKKAAKLPRRKPPSEPKQVPHYDKCKAEWERRKAERKAQFAEAQAAGESRDDKPDDWKPGARFVTPDPVMSDSERRRLAG